MGFERGAAVRDLPQSEDPYTRSVLGTTLRLLFVVNTSSVHQQGLPVERFTRLATRHWGSRRHCIRAVGTRRVRYRAVAR